VLVCFDATVLCGALRKPTGYDFRLLELAADGVLLDGFTTEVAGMEFVRNAIEGLGGVRYEIEMIEEFLDAFGTLFDADNVATSRGGRARICLMTFRSSYAWSVEGSTPTTFISSRPRSHVARA
jgi:hypothetical protein